MNNKLVSIIVPAYNSSKHLKNLINTVKSQTYKEWELIIVNDCSTDNTKKILEKVKDKNIKIINLEKNKGVANARNVGVENSNGRYIAFLDVDDLWHKDKLKKQLNHMKKEKCGFCFTSYQYLREDKLGKIVKVPKTINYNKAIKNTVIFTSTVLIDTKIIPKKLAYMPNIPRGQDSATWWNILKNGYIGYGLNTPLVYYRVGNISLSSNKLRALKRTWNLYRNHEKMSLIKSLYCFLWYVFNAVKRRI